MKRVILPNKLAGEALPLFFDFTSMLAGNDSLVGVPIVSFNPYSGLDNLSTSMGANTPTRNGAIAQIVAVAGVPGVIYTVICTCATSLGSILSIEGFLTVLPDVGQG